MERRLPNFIVIGAGRSGTTSLHHYLGQHPEIYISPHKSPNYFVSRDEQPARESPLLKAMAKQWVSNRTAYEALFDGVENEKAVGEVSPVYLQSIHAAERIKRSLDSSTKFIAILRNPADRAYAHYLGRRRDGLEPCDDFEAIVERELAQPLPDEIAFGSYIGCGRYHHFLKPYYDRFPARNIRICLFEWLQEDPSALLRELFSFLDVDPGVRVETAVRYNQGGTIRNPYFRLLWTRSVWIRTLLRPYLPAVVRSLTRPALARQVSKPSVSSSARRSIIEALRSDMEQLEELTGLEVSHWLGTGSHMNTQN